MGLLAVAAAVPAAGQPAAADPPPAATPVRAIVLVDESGSLAEAEVERERQAVSLLAQSDLSAASEFAVYGFGSSNSPGQNAVQPYCELTRVNSVEARQSLATCAGLVHRRSAEEGPDTDHASALRAAAEKLGARAGDGRLGVVFLLTDGVLDVANSPSFGADPRLRDGEANRQLDSEILPLARSKDIQIWPLGFGDADLAALQRFAAGGAGATRGCSDRSAVPQARVVGEAGDVAFALLSALSSARCSVVEKPVEGTVRNKPLELKVNIPLIATDGSIAVTKVDARIQVSYFDPEGKEVPEVGELDRQRFDRSGAQGPVEALRISNPKPGEWTVRLQAPDQLNEQRVAAVAIWQGAVRSVVGVSPVVPSPGEETQVRVRLQTRAGIITDPSALRDLAFEATATGDGFPETRVGLRDSGTKPDAKADDGEYTGSFVLPTTATGKVSVCGLVQGAGVSGDQRCAYFDVRNANVVARAGVELSPPKEIDRPGEIAGIVRFASRIPPFPATVSIDELSPDAEMRVDPPVMQVATGQEPHSFRILVGKGTALGQLSGRVQVRDNDDRVIGEAFFLTEVTEPPGWWERHRAKVLVAAVALLALLVMALRIRNDHERRRRVTGLVASLHGSEGPVGSPVQAPGGRAKQFGLRFVAEPMNFEMCSVADVGAIVISRSVRGETLVALPGAQPAPMTSVDAGGGYRIQIEDRRVGVQPVRRPVRVGQPEQTTITPPPDPDDLL
jgi:hypothetical protein